LAPKCKKWTKARAFEGSESMKTAMTAVMAKTFIDFFMFGFSFKAPIS
jgi:hypothetical protein